MTDMLVKLYDLPTPYPGLNELSKAGIEIRPALPLEKKQLLSFVGRNFSEGWAGECERAFYSLPITCCIAVHEGKIIGFACHDCTCKNFFGPMGVNKNFRKKGVGKALVLQALYAMKSNGYAYAVIGGVGSEPFYQRCVGAEPIPGSTPGIYKTVQTP